VICLNSAGSLVRTQVEKREGPPEESPPHSVTVHGLATHQDTLAPPQEQAPRGLEPQPTSAQHVPDASEDHRTSLHLRGRSRASPLPARGRGTEDRTATTPQGAGEQELTCDCYLADPETGVVPGVTRDRHMRSRCRCSMCPAIHTNSRSWLRSSSTHEPSDPPLRVVSVTTFGHARPGNTGRDQGGEESHRADSHHPRFGIVNGIMEKRHVGADVRDGRAVSADGRPAGRSVVLPRRQGKAAALGPPLRNVS